MSETTLHRITPTGKQVARLIANVGLTHYHVRGDIAIRLMSYEGRKLTVYIWRMENIVEDAVRDHCQGINPAEFMAVPVDQATVETIEP